MTTTIGYCILICLGTINIVLAVGSPELISDTNSFFKDFINYNLLNVLGIFVAITLASASQLHLSLNSIEERTKQKDAFIKTRASIAKIVHRLLWLFLAALLVVILKPILAKSPWSQTLANGAGVIVTVWNIMLLLALTEAVFGIQPIIAEDEPR